MDTATALYHLSLRGDLAAAQTFPEGIAWLWGTMYLESLWNNRGTVLFRQELFALCRRARRIKAFAHLSLRDPLPYQLVD